MQKFMQILATLTLLLVLALVIPLTLAREPKIQAIRARNIPAPRWQKG